MGKIAFFNEDQKIIKKALNLFLLFFLIIGGFLCGGIAIFYKSEINSFYSKLKSRETNSIELKSRAIGHVFDSIVSDLLFLSQQNEILALVNDKGDGWAHATALEYSALETRKKMYDQIRFLDDEGRETVRVNYNNGNPEIVEGEKLQDKSGRYYYQNSVALDRGEIFVSPLDLNIENGRIEQPLKPMIRFGTPIFSDNGEKSGIVLINYLAETLLKTIERSGDISLGNTMLLNSEGFWLLSPDSEEEWGFMIEDRKELMFSKKYPEEWATIISEKKGQIQTSNGLFSFTAIYPLEESFRISTGADKIYGPSNKEIESANYLWILLSHIPAEITIKYRSSLIVKIFFMGAGMFVVIALTAWFLALAVTRRRIYQAQLVSMAMFDALTELPNRRLFFERLEAGIEHAKRFKRKLGVLYVDLDGFKKVNDTKGHEAGDELLIRVSEILREIFRTSDIVGRLGGDEFAVVLFEIDKVEDAFLAGQKITECLSRPIELKSGSVSIGASVGAAVFPDHATASDELVKQADDAMYQSKTRGKSICTLAR